MMTEPHREHELDLVLEKKETVADGVVQLTLRRADGADLPQWEPGAHVDLVLTDDLTRQYSLCGDPAERAGRAERSAAAATAVSCVDAVWPTDRAAFDGWCFVMASVLVRPLARFTMRFPGGA